MTATLAPVSAQSHEPNSAERVDLDFTTEPAPPATVEQLVLAALMRAPRADALRYLAHLDTEDFSKGSHRAILTAMTTVTDDVAPVAHMVLANLRETRQLAGEHGRTNAGELEHLVTIDAHVDGLRFYVRELLTMSLRRAISEAGTAMTAAAEEVPTADLWEQFQAIGRRVRDSHQARLTGFLTAHNLDVQNLTD